MNYLIILNDPPYGTERSYNGLRLANSLAKDDSTTVSVFLMGDAASCAIAGQTTPNGYYNIERMLKVLASKGRQDWCLRLVHGRPRSQGRGTQPGRKQEFDGRANLLDERSRQVIVF